MESSKAGDIVAAQRAFFATGRTRDVAFRRRQLNALKEAVLGNRRAILGALREDVGKPVYEAYLVEINGVVAAIDYTLARLGRWARPGRARTPSYLFIASSHIEPEPLGTVLVIAPWNYPVDLALEPLAGAMAAGNTVVVKPSEVTPACSSVIAKILAENFEPGYVTAVEGGPAETEALLGERFDHIFYTGGAAVGRIVMEAAARNLTPVTLELGGKSPCIVEPDIDLEVASRRITWGKYFNAGQTCVAPDYLLVNAGVKEELLAAIVRWIERFYGKDPSKSPDYARIVSERHFERVKGLMGDGRIIAGGETDAARRYIAPTVIDEPAPGSRIMQEEIFGPLLPVIAYGELEEAIEYVRAREKPLSLYAFTRDRAKQRRVLSGTSSGGVCMNDTMVHFSNPNIPFGGVGASGMGRYHGRWSFDTFSNPRGVMRRSFHFDVYLRYPPYRNAQKLAQRLIRYLT